MDIKQQIKLFIEARSIALVGATRRTGDGHNVVENLLNYGYTGKLYPVNPNADDIMGVKVYHSIGDLPEGIDLALISTPRSQAPQHARECVAKGIKALIIVAQGMADVGGEGISLQQELVKIAREGGARVLGPNTFGVANAFMHLNTAFVNFEIPENPIGTIAQTGMLFGGTARRRLMGKAIDIGNTCDIDFADALEYYVDDPQIKLIAMYMEDVKDGRKFMRAAKKVTRQKPIIVLKGGRTSVGANLTKSHTGSMAGRAEIYDAAFRQCGIIRASDFDEMDDLVMGFWYLPPPKGRRVALMTNTMGAGILATDACTNWGLELATFTGETKERISRVMPPWLPVINPVDIGPANFVVPDREKVIFECMESLLLDPGVDAILFILPAGFDKESAWGVEVPNVARKLAAKYPAKPIVGWVHSNDVGEKSAHAYMTDRNIVVCPTVDRAARVLSRLLNYARFREEIKAEE